MQMNLDNLTNNIEQEIHTEHKLSEETKAKIKSVIDHRQTLLKGGSISNDTPVQLNRLSGLDAALVSSLQCKIPITEPSLKAEVVRDIIKGGQVMLPNNPNIYYAYLLNDRQQLAKAVNSSLDRVEDMQGGELANNLYKILGGAVMIVLLLVIYSLVSQRKTKQAFCSFATVNGTDFDY